MRGDRLNAFRVQRRRSNTQLIRRKEQLPESIGNRGNFTSIRSISASTVVRNAPSTLRLPKTSKRNVLVIPKEEYTEVANSDVVSHPILERHAVGDRNLADLLFAFDNTRVSMAGRREVMHLWKKMAAFYDLRMPEPLLEASSSYHPASAEIRTDPVNAKVDAALSKHWEILTEQSKNVALLPRDIVYIMHILCKVSRASSKNANDRMISVKSIDGTPIQKKSEIKEKSHEKSTKPLTEAFGKIVKENRKELQETAKALETTDKILHIARADTCLRRSYPDLLRRLHAQTKQLWRNFTLEEFVHMVRSYNFLEARSKECIRLFTQRFCEMMRDEDIFRKEIEGRHLRTMLGVFPHLKIKWIERPNMLDVGTGEDIVNSKVGPLHDKLRAAIDSVVDTNESTSSLRHSFGAKLNAQAIVDRKTNCVADLYSLVAEKAPHKVYDLQLKDFAVILNAYAQLHSEWELSRKAVQNLFERSSPAIVGKIGKLEHSMEVEGIEARFLSMIVNSYAKTNRRMLAIPILNAIQEKALGLYIYGDLRDMTSYLECVRGTKALEDPAENADIIYSSSQYRDISDGISAGMDGSNNDGSGRIIQDVPKLNKIREISLLLNACVKLDIQSPIIFAAMAPGIHTNIAKCDAQSLSVIAHAYARQQVKNERLFERIAAMGIRLSDRFNGQGLGLLCYAFGKLHLRHDELFAQLRDEIVYRGTVGRERTRRDYEAQARKEVGLWVDQEERRGRNEQRSDLFAFSLRSLEQIAHAYARLGYHDQRLFYVVFTLLRQEVDGVKQARMRLRRGRKERLRNKIAAAYRKELLQSLKKQRMGRRKVFEIDELVRKKTERKLATIFARDSEDDSVVSRLLGQNNTDLTDLDTQSVALLMQSFTNSKMPMRAVFKWLSHYIKDLKGRYSSWQIAMLWSAISRMDKRHRPLLKMLMKEAKPRITQMSPKALSILLRASTKCKVYDRQFMRQACKALQIKLPDLDAVDLISCMTGFSELQFREPQLLRMLTKLIQQQDKSFSMMKPGQVTACVRSYSNLRVFDPDFFASAYNYLEKNQHQLTEKEAVNTLFSMIVNTVSEKAYWQHKMQNWYGKQERKNGGTSESGITPKSSSSIIQPHSIDALPHLGLFNALLQVAHKHRRNMKYQSIFQLQIIELFLKFLCKDVVFKEQVCFEGKSLLLKARHVNLIVDDFMSSSSKMHRNISTNLQRVGLQHRSEVYLGPFMLDIVIGNRFVIEVDGPSHFYKETNTRIPTSLLKHSILAALGFEVRHLPYQEWLQCTSKEKRLLYCASFWKDILPGVIGRNTAAGTGTAKVDQANVKQIEDGFQRKETQNVKPNENTATEAQNTPDTPDSVFGSVHGGTDEVKKKVSQNQKILERIDDMQDTERIRSEISTLNEEDGEILRNVIARNVDQMQSEVVSEQHQNYRLSDVLELVNESRVHELQTLKQRQEERSKKDHVEPATQEYTLRSKRTEGKARTVFKKSKVHGDRSGVNDSSNASPETTSTSIATKIQLPRNAGKFTSGAGVGNMLDADAPLEDSASDIQSTITSKTNSTLRLNQSVLSKEEGSDSSRADEWRKDDGSEESKNQAKPLTRRATRRRNAKAEPVSCMYEAIG